MWRTGRWSRCYTVLAMLAAVDADCEARDDWFLEQDVNAWSSVAYVAAGALIVAIVVRRALPRAFVALGVLATLEGVGSFLYHGGSGTVGQYLHDVPLLGLLGFVAGWHASRIRGPGASAVGALVGAAVGAVAGGIAAAFGVTTVLAAVAVVVVVGTELVARRHGLPRVWNVALIVLAVVAALSWWAGTGDSALCDEQSLLQPHGAWHLLSALLLLGWFDNAMTAAWPERAPRVFRRATDRLLGLLTKALTQAFYRSVEVTGRERIPVRSAGARGRQPRQRFRRSDRRGLRPRPPPPVPRQGGALEGDRGPPVPRARRRASRLPPVRRRSAGRQPRHVRGVSPGARRRRHGGDLPGRYDR